MKSLLILFTCLTCIKAQAQNKSSLEINIETNGIKANTVNYSYFYSSYKLLDSSTSLFKKYNNELTQEIKSKVKPGISAGISYTYILNKFVKLKVGINFSSYAIERNIDFIFKTKDSSTITLQGTGPTWTDPGNGNMIIWAPANPSPWGSMFGTGGIIVLNSQRYQFRHPAEGVEKIKLMLLEIPIGISVNPNNSNFTFNAEASPSFTIKPSAVVKYNNTTEISAPNEPEYAFNNTMWFFGAGINYRISKSFETAIHYKHYLNSVLKNEDVKLKSVGLKIVYTLPLKINL